MQQLYLFIHILPVQTSSRYLSMVAAVYTKKKRHPRGWYRRGTGTFETAWVPWTRFKDFACASMIHRGLSYSAQAAAWCSAPMQFCYESGFFLLSFSGQDYNLETGLEGAHHTSSLRLKKLSAMKSSGRKSVPCAMPTPPKPITSAC